jgi:hypothetical protein
MFLAWALGGIFAASVKIADPQAFSVALSNYRLLPAELVNPAAIFLPWVELAAGAALLLGTWRWAGAMLVFGLSGMFLLAVASAMLRGLDIRCGCFGPHSGEAGSFTLLLDAGLLAASWLIINVWQRSEIPRQA